MKRANFIWQYEKQSVNVTQHPHTFVHPIKETFLWPQKLKKLSEKVKKKKRFSFHVSHFSIWRSKKKHLSKCYVRISWSFKRSFFFNKENIFILFENVVSLSTNNYLCGVWGPSSLKTPAFSGGRLHRNQRKRHRDEEHRQHVASERPVWNVLTLPRLALFSFCCGLGCFSSSNSFD